ncbi:MAG: hypothetical protein J1E56_07655 [Ruminococcus sp.]|nr:hypothetical protein [Ruminococcus sp.]
MKRNRISLDFTSLLDITMIILFWFMIHFQSTAEDEIAKANEQTALAQSYAAELEEDRKAFELEKEEWRSEADYEMQQIREADENAAKNAQALMNFQKGLVLNIKLYLESKDDWKVKIESGTIEKEVSSEEFDNFSNDIIDILEESGLTKDDVIIALYIYDGENHYWDLQKVNDKIKKSINEVSNEYKQFYCLDIIT